MKQKTKKFLKVRIISEPEFAVLFGYFDIYDKTFINVTDYVSKPDLADFRTLITKDDTYIETPVQIESDDILKILEDIGTKLAKELAEGMNDSE